MTKEDFQYIGQQHQKLNEAPYATLIDDDNGQLINQPTNGNGSRSGTQGAHGWKPVEREAMNHKRTKLEKDDAPWHALAAVKERDQKKKVD